MLSRRAAFVRAFGFGILGGVSEPLGTDPLSRAVRRLDRARGELAEAEAEASRLAALGAGYEAESRHDRDRFGPALANDDAAGSALADVLASRGHRAVMIDGRLYVDVRPVVERHTLAPILCLGLDQVVTL